MEHVVCVLHVSERRACRAIGHSRQATRVWTPRAPGQERARGSALCFAKESGRYGSKISTGLFRMGGWEVGKDRVYRIWREEGLKVPHKQPKRARLWLADGSCSRKRAEYPNHVWSYDFVADTTREGRPFRILNIVDEYTRECLASHVARRIQSQDVILVLADLFLKHGLPVHIRSDNGPEFIARKLTTWLKNVLGVEPLVIEPGSPWENGYCESFNGKMWDQLLNGELFYTLKEAQVIIERWRIHYNMVRPHSSLGGKPPAPEAIQLAS